MMSGLTVNVEMNGDLILDTAESICVHCTSTVTSSLSTVSGSVILQVRVREAPSYSGPLGTLRARVGVGTGGETHIHSGVATVDLCPTKQPCAMSHCTHGQC